MVERTEAAAALPTVTPAELAQLLLFDLRRLHEHARHESAADQSPASLLAFFQSGLEATMQGAGLLAAALVSYEAIDGSERAAQTRQVDAAATAASGNEAATVVADPPSKPGGADQVGEPAKQTPSLSFEGLCQAVEILTRDTQTRHWRAREGRKLAGTICEAVAVVQAATKAVHSFFLAQQAATDRRGRVVMGETGQPAREPDGLQVAFLAVDGARALAEAFADMRERSAGEALARVVSALSNAQNGTIDPLFVPVRMFVGRRHIDAATVIGLAAAAMDARQKAGMKRGEAAQRVASLFGGVQRHGGSTAATVGEGTVAWWRDRAKKDQLTPKHAQAQWQSYCVRLAERRGKHPKAGADKEWHQQHAAAIEGRIAAILANQGPGFTLTGQGREVDPKPRARKPKAEI